MNNKTVGAFISEKRKEKGYSQKQLAERLNVTDKAVSKWETGRGAPDISNLIPIAQALDVSVVEILSGKTVDNDSHKTDEAVIDVIKNTNSKNKKDTVKRIIAFICAVILALSSIYLIEYVYWGRRHKVLYDVKTIYVTETDEGYDYQIICSVHNWLVNINKNYTYYLYDDVRGYPQYFYTGESKNIIVKGVNKAYFVIEGTLHTDGQRLNNSAIKNEMYNMRFAPGNIDVDSEELAGFTLYEGLSLYLNDYPDAKIVFQSN